MRRLSIFFVLVFALGVSQSYAQKKAAHPSDFYESIGKSAKWTDRYVRATFGVKPKKEVIGQDSLMLSFYNPASDLEVALYFVDEKCEYIGFNDFSLEVDGINTFFTQWCIDVTEHYRLVSEKEEKYPMFEDTSYNVVFFIPEEQPLDRGMQYFMFSGFIRNEMALSHQ